MRESEIESYLVRKAAERGGHAWKWQSSRRGVPDRIVLLPDRVIFVELKAPGEKPTAQQLHVHQMMIALGHEVYVVDSKERVDEILA